MFAAWDQPLADADQPTEGVTDSDSVAAVPGGDAGSAARPVEGWLEQMRPRLVRLATRLLWCSHDAEEAVQEALILAWQRINRLCEPGKRNAWLYRTTINLCMNRRRLRKPTAPLAADTMAADAVANRRETAELMSRVRVAMSQLPARQHAALVLREMEGLNYDQVAVILKTRPANARVLVHRARESVRQTLLRQWPDSFGPER